MPDAAPHSTRRKAAEFLDHGEPVLLENLNIEAAERLLIAVALSRCDQNRTAAAALLGIHVRTLRRKLKAFQDNVTERATP